MPFRLAILLALNAVAVADVAVPRTCGPIVDPKLTRDERTLAQAWREHHDCAEPPVCDRQRDPVRVLRADVDETPGAERILANNRFGAAMFSADGRLLAMSVEAPGCRRWRDEVSGDTSVRLTASPLVLHTRNVGHCGEFKASQVLERRGDQLVVLATIDEEGRQGCNVHESRIAAQARIGEQAIIVRYRGGTRRLLPNSDDYGPWSHVDETCSARRGDDGRFHLDDPSVEFCRLHIETP